MFFCCNRGLSGYLIRIQFTALARDHPQGAGPQSAGRIIIETECRQRRPVLRDNDRITFRWMPPIFPAVRDTPPQPGFREWAMVQRPPEASLLKESREWPSGADHRFSMARSIGTVKNGAFSAARRVWEQAGHPLPGLRSPKCHVERNTIKTITDYPRDLLIISRNSETLGLY